MSSIVDEFMEDFETIRYEDDIVGVIEKNSALLRFVESKKMLIII